MEDRVPYSFEINPVGDRQLNAEERSWLVRHGTQSQLRAEVASAIELLMLQPLLGVGRANGKREIFLPRTKFWLVYSVHPRLRLIRIQSFRSARRR